MKWIVYSIVLLIVGIALGVSIQEKNMLVMIPAIIGWMDIVFRILVYFQPKIIYFLKSSQYKILNNSVRIHYQIKYSYDEEYEINLIDFKNKLLNNDVFQKVECDFKSNKILLKTKEDTMEIYFQEENIFLSCQEYNMGYRDSVKKVSLISEFINTKIEKYFPEGFTAYYSCKVFFKKSNPFIDFGLKGLENKKECMINIKSPNFIVSNEFVECSGTNVVEFNRELKENLLFK